MPSGRTSRPGLQVPDLLAMLPACSGRRQNHPCRRHHECKLGDQTKDDADKEPREKRSCGRSQTSLYNAARMHLFSQQGRANAANCTCRWSHCAHAISWRTPSSACACLISDRHSDTIARLRDSPEWRLEVADGSGTIPHLFPLAPETFDK